MPALSAEIGSYLQRVKDDLRLGQDRGARASVSLPTTSAAGGSVEIQIDDHGVAGNLWTVEVTVPGGTSVLTVTPTGTDVVIALDVNSGTPDDTENTAVLVAAAFNAAVTGATARVAGDSAQSLDAVVAQTSLSGGLDPDTAVQTAGARPAGTAGYLRGQDLASILDLLQEALDSDGDLTATGGSTTTAVVTTLEANAYVGATVVFDSATTTALLRDVEATVLSNDATTLTFTETLPAAVVNTDTFTLEQTVVDTEVSELRDGLGLGDSPRGQVYGFWRTAVHAMQKMMEQLGGSSLSDRQVSRPGVETGAGSTDSRVVSEDTDMKIDAFKGFTLTVGGETRKVRKSVV